MEGLSPRGRGNQINVSPEIISTVFDNETGIYTSTGEFQVSLGPVAVTKAFTVLCDSRSCTLSLGDLDMEP